MTLSRSRKIVVDSQRYQWRAKGSKERFAGYSPRAIHLVILASSGATLIAELASKRWDEELMGDRCYADHKASLLPKDVESVIHQAVLEGWDPTVKAKPFLLAAGLDLTDYQSIEAK